MRVYQFRHVGNEGHDYRLMSAYVNYLALSFSLIIIITIGKLGKCRAVR